MIGDGTGSGVGTGAARLGDEGRVATLATLEITR